MTTDEMIDSALANTLQTIMLNVTNRVIQGGRGAREVEDVVTSGMTAAGNVYALMLRHKALLRREDDNGRRTDVV